MGTTESIRINCWCFSALVVPLDGGLRVQFDEADWDIIDGYRGLRVVVGRPGMKDAWMMVAAETRLPPIVWVTLTDARGSVARAG